jgi:hypothetical protein
LDKVVSHCFALSRFMGIIWTPTLLFVLHGKWLGED